MRLIVILAALVAPVSLAGATTYEASVDRAMSTESATVDYTDASGRLIGSVTKIGGVTYFAGPDGVPLGVAETVNGKRVFRRY